MATDAELLLWGGSHWVFDRLYVGGNDGQMAHRLTSYTVAELQELAVAYVAFSVRLKMEHLRRTQAPSPASKERR